MISNQILQDTIDGIKAITRIDLCVMDTEGKPLASTLDAVEEYKEAAVSASCSDGGAEPAAA